MKGANENSNLKEIIQAIAKDPTAEIYSVVCEVLSIDETKRTIDVSPLNGDAEIPDVRLQADQEASTGIVAIPKKGSNVLVTFLNQKTGFVSLCTEVEKLLIDTDIITINGGTNGGLVIVDSITSKMNKQNTELTAELAKIQAAITGLGGAYSRGNLTNFDSEDYTNTKVTH